MNKGTTGKNGLVGVDAVDEGMTRDGGMIKASGVVSGGKLTVSLLSPRQDP